MSHLAIILPSLRGGGAEGVMMTLANAFAAQGHRVDLVLASAQGPFLKEVAPGVRVIDLKSKRVTGALLPLISYFRRERPHVILSAPCHVNVVALLARAISRIKARLVVSERNSMTQGLGSRSDRILLWLMRRLYPSADMVVCVSRGVEEELATLAGVPRHKLRTIYNPINFEKIREGMNAPLDHPWLKQAGVPVLLAVGRLAPQKDYPTLLRGFARLRQDRRARLVILGEGQERPELEKLCRDLNIATDVEFAGFQPNPFAWMAACDLFVMSSAWEGLPNALLQAIACGAPVVSTDCRTGPDEILEHGKWGRLVPVGDAPGLAEAMLDALDDRSPPDVQHRAEAFKIEQVVADYAEVLGLGQHNGPPMVSMPQGLFAT
ncbi:MAG TPA: glycosyltransferase [Sphingopyxis sp.]|nr:glycosyltransferase [Sphingopyxis sp.]